MLALLLRLTITLALAGDPFSKSLDADVAQLKQELPTLPPAEVLSRVDLLLQGYDPKSASQAALLEPALREAAIAVHTQGKKLATGPEAAAAFAAADQLYQRYFQLFADGPKAYDMRYAYGELLYKMKRFEDAYAQYMQVVTMNPAGPHSQFCAESAVFAAQQVMKKESKPDQGLSPWEQNLIKAIEVYVQSYPSSPKRVGMIYTAGYTYYNRTMILEANFWFNQAILANPSGKESRQAANLILDSLLTQGDWGTLRDTARTYYETPGLGSASDKEEWRQIWVAASCKLGAPPPGETCPG